MNEMVKVMFNGDELEAIPEGAKVHLPVRRFCEVLDVDPDTQARRLKADGVISTVIMTVQMAGDDQAREVLCIELRDLPLWLAKIHPSKVKASVRAKLIAYQRECAEVLAEHFFGPRRREETTPDDHLQAAARSALESGDFRALAMVAGVLDKLRTREQTAQKATAAKAAKVDLWIRVVEYVAKENAQGRGVPTANACCEALGGRRTDCLAAVREAVERGAICRRGAQGYWVIDEIRTPSEPGAIQ